MMKSLILHNIFKFRKGKTFFPDIWSVNNKLYIFLKMSDLRVQINIILQCVKQVKIIIE